MPDASMRWPSDVQTNPQWEEGIENRRDGSKILPIVSKGVLGIHGYLDLVVGNGKLQTDRKKRKNSDVETDREHL